MKTDIQIQKDVMDELKWQPLLNSSEIGVAVKNGIVALSDIVDSYSKKLSAEKAAKKVAGVKAIAEDIQIGVSLAYRKTDAEIAEVVLNALKWHSVAAPKPSGAMVIRNTITPRQAIFIQILCGHAELFFPTKADLLLIICKPKKDGLSAMHHLY
ncbi:BON domain-containing protein [Mucilaginibacter sp.]|jgi:hypothetical protein|uniref:BON domain-containing protein n=1 Tax=Mucilaginibacter sp. TaxID=1882438 RepID=UPI0035649233